MTALVHGLAVTGASVVRALRRHAHDVVAIDDRADQATQDLADALGVDLLPAPLDPRAFASQFELISPSPGVPESHPMIVAALDLGVPLMSEIELAYRWEQQRPASLGGPRPMLAITGTDGKTTTTLMATAMLEASGVRAVAAGNTDVPLVSALDHEVDAFVVECTSFRLAYLTAFRAEAAAWLNFAPDHLDWHDSLASYERAKARVWERQQPEDVAIGNLDDDVVAHHLASAPGRQVTFGSKRGDYRVEGDALIGPKGPFVAVAELRRSLPHDRMNALAAAAAVLETGLAEEDAVARALRAFEGPPHRISLVGESEGVRWYDDSKATTPHAALTAVRAFPRVVLIAGGRNKGLDLTALAGEPGRVTAVVAIGEAAPEVVAAFEPTGAPVDTAGSMDDAVRLAARRAEPGDVVLLSPGCASFDAYTGYGARGDDFARAVREAVLT